MRTALILTSLLGTAGVAAAQPEPIPPSPYPAPTFGGYPPPGAAIAPPSDTPMIPVISQEDQDLLAEGEITTGQVIGGAAVNMWFGFGLGQAVEGRWSDTGWIFTLGEGASTTLLLYGLFSALDSTTDCVNNDQSCDNKSWDTAEWAFFGGLLGAAAFHIGGIVDAITGPQHHNQRVRALRARLGYPSVARVRLNGPYLAPPQHASGAVAGFTLSF